jgi:tetratricopeptide (TPR) repeat protein
MNAVFSFLRSKLCALLLIALALHVGILWSQTAETHIPSSQAQIARDLETIRTAELHHPPPLQEALLWVQLALDYHLGAEFLKAEDAYWRALRLLKNEPSAREEYAYILDNLSSLYLIYGRLDDAESVRKQAIKVRQKLGNPAACAESEVHLADIMMRRREYKKAEQLALKGLQTMESSSKPPQAGIFTALITLTYARCSRGQCGKGLISAKQTVAFANKNFESESAANGFALETLGFAEWKTGALQDGERDMRQAVQILRTRLSANDPRVAGAMLQYQSYLIQAHRPAEAQEIHEQATRISREAGVYCQECVVSVSSLSNTLR